METLHLIPTFLKLKIDAYAAAPDALTSPVADAESCPLPARPSARKPARPGHQAAASAAARPAQGIVPFALRRPEPPAPVAPVEAIADSAFDRLPDFDVHWAPSLRAVGASGDGRELFERLCADHQSKERRYHTLTEVGECLARLARWQAHAENPHEIAVAIWFKDAVYDPQRHDNEGRSARLAFDSLVALGVDAETARRVRDLVVLTRHDGPPSGVDARLMVDIDQGIFGASPERYAQYEQQLREEMSHITDFIYRRRRVEALKAQLARLHIFHTDAVRVEIERQARANLQGTVARLQNRGLTQAA
jgi:predicted metal-dependent HD superfamily phosphohydrolase